jgi:16S rRNA (uracil1498-N3)-methyltransferase
MTRLYVDAPLALHAELSLPDDAAHHLLRVLRANLGDRITLFNNHGGAYETELIEAGKRHATVRLLSFQPDDCTSSLHTHIGQVMSRGERMDYAIQKATELGVSEITPLFSERCELKLRGEERADKKLEHWRRIAVAACEQSGRNRLPVIHPPLDIGEWQQRIDATLKLVLAPAVKGALPAEGSPGKVALLIGPEGGLSEREIALACQHGFHPWQIGPRVLRTETAPVAALAILQSRFGDLG